MLGLGSAHFLFFAALYVRKLAARPMVLFEDMTNPAARAGVAAAAMSMMLLAAALLPFGISVPQVWWIGVILQIGASAIVCHAIWRDAPEHRQFSPFQYLTFVGPIVGPIAGIPLGYVRESIWLTFAALVAFVVITFGNGWQMKRTGIALNLRPTLAIFLASNCLFAISFGLLGFDGAFALFYGISNLVALILLLRVRWLIRGGWSPIWASFTFPAASFVNLQVLATEKGAGVWAEIGVYAGITVATPLILLIAYRFVLMWVTGELSDVTEAAVA